MMFFSLSLYRYIFSLSFVTKRGPTSIRILYKHSRFFLDSEKEEMRNSVQQPRSNSHPAVDSCVLGMILKYTGCLQRTNNYNNNNTTMNGHHYINQVQHKNSTLSLSDSTKSTTQKGFSCYWFDKGQRQEITVHLISPLNQSKQKQGSIQQPPDPLKSLCRSKINASARTWELSDEQIEQLPVKENIRKFIKSYPYPL